MLSDLSSEVAVLAIQSGAAPEEELEPVGRPEEADAT
jgi:hypothetical protein